MNAVDPMKICYKTTDKLERVHWNEAPILGRLNRDGMVIVQLFRLLESMGYIAQKVRVGRKGERLRNSRRLFGEPEKWSSMGEMIERGEAGFFYNNFGTNM